MFESRRSQSRGALYTLHAAAYPSRMLRRAGAWTCVALFAACGGSRQVSASSGSVDPNRALPTLEGRVVYDHPLSEANANVTALWNAAHSMLADPLPAPPADADASAFQAWTRDVLGPWSQARRAALASIQPAAHQLLADDPRDQLFATVVLSVLYDDFANQIRTIPPPPSIAADSRARDAYREVLAGTVAPLGRLAREGFVRCAELGARVRSPLDSWRAACDAHAQSINEWLPPDASNAPRP